MNNTPSPQELANKAIEEVLRTQWEGAPAIRLDSPPGAGKTGVVERLAVQSGFLLKERCMIATPTNEQCFDLARRLASGYPRLRFTLFTRKGLPLPSDLPGFSNLEIINEAKKLPTGPGVILANALKWSSVEEDLEPFDCLVVDEAFQLPDYRYHPIAGMAKRSVLVGDPGQIAPVVSCEVERWQSDPAGPHVACPQALVARHPWVRRMALPVSRRLVEDTVQIVQPAFYPELPFRALCAPGERALVMPAAGITPLDRPLDLAGRGASLVLCELPARITGEVDEELAHTLVALLTRLFERGARVRDETGERPLSPEMVGVVCAHVSQVNAVKERLPRDLSGVFVETSNRFQGLEKQVMFVHHPLSGRADADDFHLDAGRLCVMMSRHRVACFLLARGGLEQKLLRHTPNGERVLGVERDEEYEGWRAHLTVLQELRTRERILTL